jgi:uncharacterized protein (DUF1015 family)
MADIAAFQALRYNPARVAVSDVVTQPYDKITGEMQEKYYLASPYNLVRIILGKKSESDSPNDNAYTRAAASFVRWRQDKILVKDEFPSIYTYTQRFSAPRTDNCCERRGFIALGRIEDYSAGIVHRHEQTLSKPKADRLDLLRATRAHFGQIFMLYSDPAGEVEKLLEPADSPQTELRDEYGVEHRLWSIRNPRVVNMVREKMRDKKLIIADGHHRYETALNYRNERRTSEGKTDEASAAPYEFAMMTFVNMDAPGLLVLPTHRVVHGVSDFSAETLRTKAAGYFEVREIPSSLNGDRAVGILRDAGRGGCALLAVSKHKALLLEGSKAKGSEIFNGFSERQQSLDVVQLHKCLLEGVLGFSEESIRNQQNVRYVRDAEEALQQVRSGEANAAFLMNPVRMQQVRDIAFAGEVLPQKSTDFYPKLLSGLTIYALE